VSRLLHVPATLPRGKSTCHTFDRRLCEPQNRSRRDREVKILDLTGIELRPLGRRASSCTDYAIPAALQMYQTEYSFEIKNVSTGNREIWTCMGLGDNVVYILWHDAWKPEQWSQSRRSLLGKRLCKQVPAGTNKQGRIEVLLSYNDGNSVFCGFAPRLYNEDPRPAEGKIIEGVSWDGSRRWLSWDLKTSLWRKDMACDLKALCGLLL
jgi:hypothetical protein